MRKGRSCRRFPLVGASCYNGCCNEDWTGVDTEAIKVRRIGNSLGLILSREMLAALNVSEGDDLFVVRTPDGLRLTAYDPHFAAALQSGRRHMRRYRNALRELARR